MYIPISRFRHAFDFGAASQAFQEYLRNGGVEFAVEEMNPKVRD